MNPFVKRPSRKNTWLIIFLLFGVTAGVGYFVYDTFFADKTMVATINPYNFTDVGIADIYVDGTWGGSVDANSGGGGSVCCVMVPRKWRPGLIVHVKWQRDDNQKWYTSQAEIPPYSESHGLQILFFKNDRIGVYLIDYWPCNSMHPMPKSSDLCGDSKKHD
jgi:hypothetical protein